MVRRLALVLLAAATLTGFNTARYRAGIHPIVGEHLDYANKAQKEGRSEEAAGYAQALLIGPEIRYRALFETESEPHRKVALESLAAAAEMWETSLDGAVRIRPAEGDENAELIIHFQPEVTHAGRQVSGYIRWRRDVRRVDGKWVGSFDGQVFSRTTLGGRAMSGQCLRATLAHEMGHMFGLPDTAPDTGRNLMGPLNVGNPTTHPNSDELLTVRHIREDAAAVADLAKSGTETHVLELDHAHE